MFILCDPLSLNAISQEWHFSNFKCYAFLYFSMNLPQIFTTCSNHQYLKTYDSFFWYVPPFWKYLTFFKNFQKKFDEIFLNAHISSTKRLIQKMDHRIKGHTLIMMCAKFERNWTRNEEMYKVWKIPSNFGWNWPFDLDRDLWPWPLTHFFERQLL